MSAAALDLDASPDQATGRLRGLSRRLRANLGVALSVVFLALLVTAALVPEPLAPLIWFRPGRTSWFYWLTPYLLSDPATVRFWTAMLQAAVPTLAAALAASLGALLLGGPIGVLAGLRAFAWIGRPLRALLGVVDAFPPLVLALVAIVALAAIEITIEGWSAPREAKLALVLALLFAPRIAQVAETALRHARAQPHLVAERALGASAWRIATGSVLRRCGGPLVCGGAGLVGAAIALETTLSFLGLGMPPTLPSWGALLAAGLRPMFAGNWLAVVAPATLLLLTLSAVNCLAQALCARLGETRAS